MRLISKLFFLVALTSCAYASLPVPAELPDLVEKILPGVVNVSSTTVINYEVYGMDDFLRFWGVPQARKQTSLGSGFIIDLTRPGGVPAETSMTRPGGVPAETSTTGYVLTNDHVVEHASEVLVTLYDKRQFKAKIIGKDQKMDLALLQIRDEHGQTPKDLTPIPLGDSDKVRIAETVFAVGNPFGLQHTVTAGIISAKNRTIGQGPFDNFLQTDASINPGNSGGPLFSLKGEVVGINTMIFSRTGQSGGLGFAIPVNEAKNILGDLKKYGHVPRPWLGVAGQPMTPQLARYYNLESADGVLVYNLIQGGPADRAGIEDGDIVLSINGTHVAEPNDIERALAKQRPNQDATLEILRGAAKSRITVHLREMPRLDNIPQGII
jgi:serine protease Do